MHELSASSHWPTERSARTQTGWLAGWNKKQPASQPATLRRHQQRIVFACVHYATRPLHTQTLEPAAQCRPAGQLASSSARSPGRGEQSGAIKRDCLAGVIITWPPGWLASWRAGRLADALRPADRLQARSRVGRAEGAQMDSPARSDDPSSREAFEWANFREKSIKLRAHLMNRQLWAPIALLQAGPSGRGSAGESRALLAGRRAFIAQCKH